MTCFLLSCTRPSDSRQPPHARVIWSVALQDRYPPWAVWRAGAEVQGYLGGTVAAADRRESRTVEEGGGMARTGRANSARPSGPLVSEVIRRSLAENTRIAYRAGWKRFAAYCRSTDTEPTEATPADVVGSWSDWRRRHARPGRPRSRVNRSPWARSESVWRRSTGSSANATGILRLVIPTSRPSCRRWGGCPTCGAGRSRRCGTTRS